MDLLSKIFRFLPHWFTRFFEKSLKSIPSLQKKIDDEYDTLLGQMEKSIKPYQGKVESRTTLPAKGISRTALFSELEGMAAQEQKRWQDGYVSGGVYHGDQDHINFLNSIYTLFSQSNPLHSDLFPSIVKFEAEIIAMTGSLLGRDRAKNASVCGSVSSGGTESILLAMKTYRDQAREERGITHPEIITCTTAHAAFDKAAHYFGIRQIRVPFDSNFKMNISETKKQINRNTIALVGSAPSFPHGVIDPIEELSELAVKHQVGLHVDACLGGFVLPFAKKLGYPVPLFDFELPGVTSMSADTHKYGYAAKGTSVVLYRTEALRHYQYYTTTEWPGGLYFSPTFAGSRPGALSAACYAALISTGEEGYLKNVDLILKTAEKIKNGIRSISDLKLFGDSLFVIAFGSDTFDIYRVLDLMAKKHWNLNGLHKPACLHLAVTLRQTTPGVAERFLSDLKESVEFVKKNPSAEGGLAPVYGLGATLPFRGLVSDLLKKYMDILYKP